LKNKSERNQESKSEIILNNSKKQMENKKEIKDSKFAVENFIEREEDKLIIDLEITSSNNKFFTIGNEEKSFYHSFGDLNILEEYVVCLKNFSKKIC